MKQETPTFATTIKQFEYRYDLRSVFNDFLTMALCAFSQNPDTGKSHDEDLYLETVAKYKDDNLRFEFPKLLACLTNEMTDRIDSSEGNDVLGDFYEQNLCRKGASQYFTPWPICAFMAQSTCDAVPEERKDSLLRIMDPTCGSGRMLLASARVCGPYQEYYGVDIDETCVKMTAMNFFLNGLFHSEVLCADALMPEDFRVSYKVSFFPFGVFRITEKEKSPLWHLLNNCWDRPQKKEMKEPPVFDGKQVHSGNQMTFF
jgi:type I restriction-modification system DNA methylase subunit